MLKVAGLKFLSSVLEVDSNTEDWIEKKHRPNLFLLYNCSVTLGRILRGSIFLWFHCDAQQLWNSNPRPCFCTCPTLRAIYHSLQQECFDSEENNFVLCSWNKPRKTVCPKELVAIAFFSAHKNYYREEAGGPWWDSSNLQRSPEPRSHLGKGLR